MESPKKSAPESSVSPRPFALERWFAEFEFVPGMRVLSASGAVSPTAADVLALGDESATSQYLELGLDYIDNHGNAELRAALASLYDTLDADDIRITTGASEGILLLLWSGLMPGDNVVAENPCYQSHAEVAASLGAEVRTLELAPEDGWIPNPDRLAALVDRRTRFVLINHPHNPTGSVLDTRRMKTLLVATEHADATLISDEVFRPIALTGSTMVSAADLSARAVSIGDLSKPWGLAGLRVGWVASKDHARLRGVSETRDYTTMCCAGPAEYLAATAMQSHQQLLTPRVANACDNLAMLAEMMAASGGRVSGHLPTAGYSAFLRLHNVEDTRDWCRSLAHEDRVLLLPGGVFGDRFEAYVRIGFGGDPQIFREGIEIISRRLPK